MYRVLATGVSLFILGGCCSTPRKVAVLIAAEKSQVNSHTGDSEFWHDTVILYCMLRKNGFDAKNIYVFYGDGRDGYHVDSSVAEIPEDPDGIYAASSTRFCQNRSLVPHRGQITDFPMAFFGEEELQLDTPLAVGCLEIGNTGKYRCKQPLCAEDATTGSWVCPPAAVLECLGKGCDKQEVRAMIEQYDCPGCSSRKIPRLDPDDYLFVWWKGHGSVPYSSSLARFASQEFALSVGMGAVTADQVSSWMTGIKARHRTLVFDTCHSGCLEELPDKLFSSGANPAPIVLAAAPCGMQARLFDTENYSQINYHGPFSYWVASTLRGRPFGFITTSKDIDGDGTVDFPDGIELSRGGPLKKTFAECKKAVEIQVNEDSSPVLKDPDHYSEHTKINARKVSKKADRRRHEQ